MYIHVSKILQQHPFILSIESRKATLLQNCLNVSETYFLLLFLNQIEKAQLYRTLLTLPAQRLISSCSSHDASLSSPFLYVVLHRDERER